jgi:hypothetical protein
VPSFNLGEVRETCHRLIHMGEASPRCRQITFGKYARLMTVLYLRERRLPAPSDNLGKVPERVTVRHIRGRQAPLDTRSYEVGLQKSGLCDTGNAVTWCRGITEIAVYPHIFSLATSRCNCTFFVWLPNVGQSYSRHLTEHFSLGRSSIPSRLNRIFSSGYLTSVLETSKFYP